MTKKSTTTASKLADSKNPTEEIKKVEEVKKGVETPKVEAAKKTEEVVEEPKKEETKPEEKPASKKEESKSDEAKSDEAKSEASKLTEQEFITRFSKIATAQGMFRAYYPGRHLTMPWNLEGIKKFWDAYKAYGIQNTLDGELYQLCEEFGW